MRFLFATCLLVVLLTTGVVLTFGRMLSALLLPQSEKPLQPLEA